MAWRVVAIGTRPRGPAFGADHGDRNPVIVGDAGDDKLAPIAERAGAEVSGIHAPRITKRPPARAPVTGDRFGDALGQALAGFERVEGVDYAQSWLVTATDKAASSSVRPDGPRRRRSRPLRGMA
jgi:hypothetical protein